jgi:pimeloyl-ACP methyl ester carboxylesterase
LLLSARDRGAWQESDLREFVEATQASARPAQQVLWQYVLKELPRMLRRYGGQRLAVPTILLAGDHDVVVPPSLLDGDSSRVGRLEARLVPGCGHQLPVEAPTQVVAALGSFDSVC